MDLCQDRDPILDWILLAAFFAQKALSVLLQLSLALGAGQHVQKFLWKPHRAKNPTAIYKPSQKSDIFIKGD